MKRIIYHPASHIIGVMELNLNTKRVVMNMLPNTQAVRDGLGINNQSPPTIIDEGPMSSHVTGSLHGYKHIQLPDKDQVNSAAFKQGTNNLKKKPVSWEDFDHVKKTLRRARTFNKLIGK